MEKLYRDVNINNDPNVMRAIDRYINKRLEKVVFTDTDKGRVGRLPFYGSELILQLKHDKDAVNGITVSVTFSLDFDNKISDEELRVLLLSCDEALH